MIRVLIVDEIRLTCDMFATVLRDEPDIEVVGCATTVSEALAQRQDYHVVLATTTLPNDGAFELTRTITRLHPSIKVLIVGLSDSKSAIIRYIEAGAAGYVHREEGVNHLLANIRAAYREEALVSPEIAAALMSRLVQLATLSSSAVSLDQVTESVELTSREREVLHLIRQDFSNREIARHLIIEVGTVKNHVHNILAKLNVNSRRDAAAYWAMAGGR